MFYLLRTYKKLFFVIWLVLFSLTLVSCGSRYSDVLDGTWYEQKENGALLIISGSELTYKEEDYFQTSKFDAKESDRSIQIIPVDEGFIFEDITYYFDDYSILAHSKSIKGNAGYVSVLFGKWIYIAPEPVSGELIDKTDPDAPKEISDYTVTSMDISFNVVPKPVEEDDPQEETDSDIQYGKYEYSLRVEDGRGTLSSLVCPDVIVSEKWISDFGELIKELGIVALNGYDKRTYMLSDEFPDYTIDIMFDSGESIHSSANGGYITDIWYSIQKELQKSLMEAIVAGGYDLKTGEFHTTQPLKRIGMSDSDSDLFGISVEEKRIEKDGKKYTYKNYVDYRLFTGGDSAHSSLVQSLKEINDYISTSANKVLEENFTAMEEVPAEERSGVEEIYCYGFYQIDKLHSDQKIFWFRLSSGNSTNLPSDTAVNNTFSYKRYCFDPNTGRRISPGELFVNQDWLEADITQRLLEIYKEGPAHDKIDSSEFRNAIHNMLSDPETYGFIEWELSYHYLIIYIPEELIPELDYRVELQFYYDKYQDQLSDDYTDIW